MKQTIDKKVINVLKKENAKLSKDQKSAFQVIKELERFNNSPSENYTIAPKDTIGKSVRYNVGRT